ncbi:MAG: curli production assembly protein CsgF [Sedimenticola sp.]|jgi:curli production assembly/transport component CsgF|nr:MAG: curli production assembly protein CsgF [Sedimenticola sp.]
MNKRIVFVFAWMAATLPFTTNSSELVYQPINPSFGGSALNGSYLLSNAQAQNNIENPDLDGYTRPTALDRLTSSLESRLISQLLADVGDGNSGYLSTDDYIIQIDEGSDGTLSVIITDLLTNDTTQIEVNGLIPD